MEKRKDWFYKNKYRIGIYVIALIGFIFMCLYAGKRSLWMDDIAQIYICRSENFWETLLKMDNNPPLSHFITYLWLLVAPYGTGWLKLPSIIFVTIGALFCAETGRKLYGDLCGMIICAFAVSSSSIVELGAYVVRPYGLLFGVMAVVLYCYVQRNLQKFRWSRVIVLGICMAAAVYTHYFAVLSVFVMFCFDCYLVIKKKSNWKIFLSYLIVGGSFLPWFIYTAQTYYEKLQTFWAAVPTIYNVVDTVQTLLGNNEFSFSLFIIIVVGMIVLRIKKKEHSMQEDITLSFALQIVVALMVVYVYSKYVKPEGSIYVNRYFITIAPCIFLIMGIGINYIVHYLNERMSIKELLNVLCIAFCVSALYNNFYVTYTTQSTKKEPYEEMADYVMAQEDIYHEDVAVYNSGYRMIEGWDYYLTHNGAREGKTCLYLNDINDISVLDGIERVYVCKLHVGIPSVTNEILESYFQLTYTDSKSGVLVYDRIH